MFVLLGAILGALIGALVAKRRKGKLADILQYGFVYCLIFSVAGLFLTILVHRLSL